MSDAVNLSKLIAGAVTASAAVPAAMDSIQQAERMILGVPQSILLFAIVGVLIGFLLLPEKDTDRITPDDNVVGRVARARQMAVRMISLAVFLFAFAVVAAWLVALSAFFFPSLAGAPQPALAGISGLLVRRMLPKYLRVAERVTSSIGGKGE